MLERVFLGGVVKARAALRDIGGATKNMVYTEVGTRGQRDIINYSRSSFPSVNKQAEYIEKVNIRVFEVVCVCRINCVELNRRSRYSTYKVPI